jgi:hypothetical protein
MVSDVSARMEAIKTALATLSSLECISYVDRDHWHTYHPVVIFDTIVSTNLQQFFLQTHRPIDVSLWKTLGTFCPNLKIIQFPDNRTIWEDVIEVLFPLSFKEIYFNFWDYRSVSYLTTDFILAVLSTIQEVDTRIEMGWESFLKICPNREKLFDIAMSSLFVDNVWIQHDARGEGDTRIWYERGVVENWFEGSTSVETKEEPEEKHEWLETRYPLTYVRISLDVVRKGVK